MNEPQSEIMDFEIEDNVRSFGLTVERCKECRTDVAWTIAEAEELLRCATNSVGAEYVLEHLEVVEVSHTDGYRGGCVTDITCMVKTVRIGGEK